MASTRRRSYAGSWGWRWPCGRRAAGPGGPVALPEPMGLSLARRATAPSQQSAPGHHYGWVTGLCLPGAGSTTRLVSLASPTQGDPVVEAAFYHGGGDQHAAEGEEERVADPR